jgi:hypothetical protein
MRTSVEILNHAAVLLHIPEERGNSVKVLLGGADGPLITIDGAGHIHVTPSGGPGDPELRQAISVILQGVQVLSRFAGQANAAGAGR